MRSEIDTAPFDRRSLRVLVAGATGYLGGHVVRELAARGHRVRAVARRPDALDRLRDLLDDAVVAEVTRPETLEGVCEGIDVVFSSVGITRQRDGLTFRDVDLRGNLNLLRAARRAGVRRFVYVSVFDGPKLRHLDIVDAHEAFVDELQVSGLRFAVLRPTGYFSDMGQLLEMARAGRVWLIGSGESRVNPIHGADLAAVCADAVEAEDPALEIDLGGPQAMTWNQAAGLAFEVAATTPRVTRIPVWLMWSAVRVLRLLDRHRGELLAFFTTMATRDVVAPQRGGHTLDRHYRGLLE